MIEKLLNDDMAAFDEPHPQGNIPPYDPVKHIGNPGSARIDKSPGLDLSLFSSVTIFDGKQPFSAFLARVHALGPRQDECAVFERISRIEHNEPGILHTAVGVLEAPPVMLLQWLAGRIFCQVECSSWRQEFPAAEMIVKKEPDANDRPRSQTLVMGQDKTQGSDDVRCEFQQNFPLAQRFPHQAKFKMLKISEPAVNELGRCG
jgi:hypothetical protein